MIRMAWCDICLHFRDGETCPAFPRGIPKRFLLEGVAHHEVVDGQAGRTVFAVADRKSAREALSKFFSHATGNGEKYSEPA